MTFFAWIAIGLLLAKMILMLDRRVPSDLIALGIIGTTLITGTLSTKDALASFSNESVVLVGALSIVVSGLIFSGMVNWISEHMFVHSRNMRNLLKRLMISSALMSAFIMVDAIVIISIDLIRNVARRLKIPDSQLLLPLAYASTLGSICTLLGSPANIVIADFYNQATGEAMPIFEPLIPGLVCTAVGLITIQIFRHRLPNRNSPEKSFADSADYTVELQIPTDSHVVGKTISEAGLDRIHGGHLIEIVRFDREVISPVPADEFLFGGDHLVFAGQINSILDLRKSHGLVNATHHVFHIADVSKKRNLQMATIDPNSPLIGHRMSDTSFEDSNGLVLVAIARQGNRVEGIPREVSLRAGDTLLLESSQPINPESFSSNLNFLDSEILLQAKKSKPIFASLILAGVILLSTFKVMPLLHCSILAAMLIVILGCCNFKQAQNAIHWKLLMIFAGSVCLGKALDVTGVSAAIGKYVGLICDDDAFSALIFLAIVTAITTEFIGGPLCAAIFAPIAIHTATLLNSNVMAFCIAVLISTNAAFLTPIGSNANTIVYGPGGYKFTDYLGVGFPLKIVILVTNIIMVNLLYTL